MRNQRSIDLFVAILAAYVASFFFLSRASLYVLRSEYVSPIAYYFIPVPTRALVKFPSLKVINRSLYYFYYPIWVVDIKIFQKGPGWI